MKTHPRLRLLTALACLAAAGGQSALARSTIAGFLLVALASHLMTGTANAHTFSVIKRFGIPENVTGFQPSPLVQGADGTLYGTTSGGEGNIRGTVFKVQPDGSGFAAVKSFTNQAEGAQPYNGSALALSGSTLYGTTSFGGNGNPPAGTVFKVNTDGSGYAVLKHFSINDGLSPRDLTLSGNELFGTTSISMFPGVAVFKLKTDGTGYTILKEFTAPAPARPFVFMTVSDGIIYGAGYRDFNGFTSGGFVFKLNTDGTGYTVLRSFPGSEKFTSAPAQAGGVLYGTTPKGGNFNRGIIFKLNTDGTGYEVIKHFGEGGTIDPSTGKFLNGDGAAPGSLEVSGNTLYGTTGEGGSAGAGILFKVSTDGTGYVVLTHFTASDGAVPGRLLVSGSTLFGTATGGISSRGMLFKMNTGGSGFTVLKQFTYSDAAGPHAGLELSGSTFYGTTGEGGTLNVGTVFKLSTDGTGYTILKHFADEDGANPEAGLTLSGSVLYGTTRAGGGSNSGSIFKINTDGTGYAVLKRFSPWTFDPDTGKRVNSDGAWPRARMELSGSTLYGTTTEGGSLGYGTVFRMNTDGTGYTVLRHLDGSSGAFPAGRVVLSAGILYGTTKEGGNVDLGTVFKMNTDGTGYTVLRHFDEGDGSPATGPVLSGSTLYGTTAQGGDWGTGTVFKLNINGTGYAVLHHFSELTFDPSLGAINDDGAGPGAGLTLSGSTLYGMTTGGGKFGGGAIFQVNTDGTRFSTLRHTSPDDDGVFPGGDMTVSGSTLYGAMSQGGSNFSSGTIFKLLISEEATVIGLAADAGTVRFSFGGLGGLRYQVQRSIDLLNWTSLGTITMPAGGEFTQVDNNAPVPAAFYRAARVP